MLRAAAKPLGRPQVSSRKRRRIAELQAEGKSIAAIARAVKLSRATVRKFLSTA